LHKSEGSIRPGILWFEDQRGWEASSLRNDDYRMWFPSQLAPDRMAGQRDRGNGWAQAGACHQRCHAVLWAIIGAGSNGHGSEGEAKGNYIW